MGYPVAEVEPGHRGLYLESVGNMPKAIDS